MLTSARCVHRSISDKQEKLVAMDDAYLEVGGPTGKY